MKNRILILIALISTVSFVEVSAQQDAQYTQYMYNTMSVNPAYAGARDGLSALLLYRTQWVGLDGAPDTATFNIHSPLGGEDGKVGLGLSIVNDRIGPTQETYVDIDFSYTINTSDQGRLSLGLKAGGHLLDIKYSELSQYNSGDALLNTDIDNKFSPNIGAGIYYRNADKWYLGLSVPNLLETTHFDEASLSEANERMNAYLMGGYVFDVNTDLKLKPAFLVKAVTGAPLQADVTLNALYQEKFTFGLAYRWDAALSGLLGYQVSESVMLGFGYDRETTDLGQTQFNSGSFEVFLRFEPRDLTKILSPRFF
ncbi:type IX secretion system membrane protein PorP/SprF [Olleya aquimaris]|uniref:Type IX secretion system membrane protein PorP/SprF n=1 Tax=Olleya sediminilitoris TaxID=2795739 RepID=A0ABS1WKD1_9FLAO|nr:MULTISPECIES: type IX secretion system membrane protein PorP/SprF [Olleya]AXO81490.1 type IX secretion system membrane protein PorP/SprF [Olleya aquimaris]MBL7559585.1 type IX secretion system membrane protein PorP/SprF [Olleya sediminilitoris]